MLKTCTELGLTAEEIDRLGAVWGKSAALGGGTMNLLISHMLDTAAVAERVWDSSLAASLKHELDTVAGGPGKGRRLFVWLCGIHDCGKATPAFVRISPAESAAVRAAGLTWRTGMVTAQSSREWRHDKAGAHLLRLVLRQAGWPRAMIDWVCPLVSGHHGTLRAATPSDLTHAMGEAHGRGPEWGGVQRHLVQVFTRALGYEDLAAMVPLRAPSRAVQLAVLGFVVMADWIASDARYFRGIPELGRVSAANARRRAGRAWKAHRLAGGLHGLEVPAGDVVAARFGKPGRPSQSMTVDAAREMGAPGLLIVEAPMGEGKTVTALACAEVLAARFGMSGVFMGMPTQATCDPMFTQLRSWLSRVQPGAEDDVVLLHGKRTFNREWKAIQTGDWATADARFRSVDEDSADCCTRQGPADFVLGPKRGLLGQYVVGTIDQLLYAATRTRHVMLRTAGLAGKVVILDEVHACDVYMSQFLHEALHWLGQAGVPVILLSATLPPEQRARLAEAYMSGAEPGREVVLPEPGGYPSATAVWPGMDAPLVNSCAPYRQDWPITVRVLPEPAARTHGARTSDVLLEAPTVALLREKLAGGGCALVIRNTVRRAQRTYRQLAAAFPGDTVILHGQLTTSTRAERTEDLIDRLGPGETTRPGRLIVVATQVAEQSFDIDADLLITDIAPVDLLLQRIGRVHRHQSTRRPEHLTQAAAYVTALTPDPDGGPPQFERGTEFVYGRHLLLRTAARVIETADTGGTWAIASDVPRLVADTYGTLPVGPPSWKAEAKQAEADWQGEQQARADAAAPFLLTRVGEHAATNLDGLHYAATEAPTEDHLAAAVRDGDMSIETVLITRTPTGYQTLTGRHSLGADGSNTNPHLDTLAGDTMRLPQRLTTAALTDLNPLPAWTTHPWLRHTRALILNPDNTATVGQFLVRYDPSIGLTYADS
ncbi:CRISPR-associated helicase Cas3' [Streptomyces sp. NPDC059447]|uniref:CRISPR-associated helicase Cas3' n=1 Tax=Streptomyces sp. NPDC059447 TaxID=3346834 RepID=UPI0036B858D4